MLKTRLTFALGSLVLAGGATAAANALLLASPFQEGMPVVEQTEHHKLVQRGIGNWEGTLTMPNPMGEGEIEMPCTERVEAVGKYWTFSKFECEMMPGVNFEGSSMMGYDPAKKQFVGTWIDQFNPAITHMTGELLEDGRIAMSYEMPNDQTGEMTPRRNLMHVDEDHVTIEFHETVDGEEKQTMTIKMKRTK